jgi:hypothetical protein
MWFPGDLPQIVERNCLRSSPSPSSTAMSSFASLAKQREARLGRSPVRTPSQPPSTSDQTEQPSLALTPPSTSDQTEQPSLALTPPSLKAEPASFPIAPRLVSKPDPTSSLYDLPPSLEIQTDPTRGRGLWVRNPVQRNSSSSSSSANQIKAGACFISLSTAHRSN